MDRGKVLKATILTTLMIVLIVGYYYYLSSRNEKTNSDQNAENTANEMSIVQELIAKAAYREYPSTPVQVVKYYNEITECFYNEAYSDSELEQLAKMSRELMDQELVDHQDFASYMESLKQDIKVFNNGNITIYESQVTPSTDVEYFEHKGFECAKLYSVYTLKSGTLYQATKEVYILRKDEQGHWKIYGFALAEEKE